MLMRRNLRHAVTLLECLDDHFLLDGRDVLFKRKRPEDFRPDRPKTVLALGELDIETVIDTGRDEGASHESKTLIESAMKFAGTADEARPRDVIRPAFQNRMNKGRYIIRIMRTVRIDENRDFPCQIIDGRPNGLALAFPVIEDDPYAQRPCNSRRIVRRMPVYDEDIA